MNRLTRREALARLWGTPVMAAALAVCARRKPVEAGKALKANPLDHRHSGLWYAYFIDEHGVTNRVSVPAPFFDPNGDPALHERWGDKAGQWLAQECVEAPDGEA